MTDRYENIRKALAMGPTPGPWHLNGEGIRALVRDANGVIVAARHRMPGHKNETIMRLIAACDPDTIRELLEERDALRELLQVLVNWTPSADTYRRLGFNPEVPMQAHDAAKALLAKEGGK